MTRSGRFNEKTLCGRSGTAVVSEAAIDLLGPESEIRAQYQLGGATAAFLPLVAQSASLSVNRLAVRQIPA